MVYGGSQSTGPYRGKLRVVLIFICGIFTDFDSERFSDNHSITARSNAIVQINETIESQTKSGRECYPWQELQQQPGASNLQYVEMIPSYERSGS